MELLTVINGLSFPFLYLPLEKKIRHAITGIYLQRDLL